VAAFYQNFENVDKETIFEFIKSVFCVLPPANCRQSYLSDCWC